MLKILGGVARGFPLQVPKKDLIRPTSVLLKRRIFDRYQNLQEYSFIDICAGSGAMGIEAWSRGASRVFLVEPNRVVRNILIKNVDKICQGYPESQGVFDISGSHFEGWMRQFCKKCEAESVEYKKKMILFFDPPYENHKLYHSFISEMTKWSFCQIWIESDEQKGLPKDYWQSVFRSYEIIEQGSHYIVIAH